MKQNSVLKNGLILGVIMAIANIILALVFYVMGVSITVFTFTGISWVIAIALLIWGVINMRKNNGGLLTFGQGFLMVLIAGLCASIIYYFFNLLYVNYIDINYIEDAMASTIASMEKMGVTVTDAVEEQLRTNFEESTAFSVKNIAIIILGSAIGYSILGAILGGVFSKKDPNKIEE